MDLSFDAFLSSQPWFVFWDFVKKKGYGRNINKEKDKRKINKNRWKDFSKKVEGIRGKVKYKCGKVEK